MWNKSSVLSEGTLPILVLQWGTRSHLLVIFLIVWVLLFRVCVRSRCWDACMVVDGGTSFEFNDGAIATITMNEEDQLRTVLLEN